MMETRFVIFIVYFDLSIIIFKSVFTYLSAFINLFIFSLFITVLMNS